MPDPRDMVDIDGLRGSPAAAPSGPPRGPRRRFLAVWFRCCHVYGRMYRNRDETAYEGRCPRCGAMVDALIGPHGTSRRVFEAI